MFSIIRLICVLAPVLYIVGCSNIYGEQGIIRDRDKEYLKAQSIPPLNIPEGYSSTSLQENYPVPVKHYPEDLKKVDLIPPELNTSGN